MQKCPVVRGKRHEICLITSEQVSVRVEVSLKGDLVTNIMWFIKDEIDVLLLRSAKQILNRTLEFGLGFVLVQNTVFRLKKSVLSRFCAFDWSSNKRGKILPVSQGGESFSALRCYVDYLDTDVCAAIEIAINSDLLFSIHNYILWIQFYTSIHSCQNCSNVLLWWR